MVDLLDMVIPEEQEEQIKQSLEEKTKYKVRIMLLLLGSDMYVPQCMYVYDFGSLGGTSCAFSSCLKVVAPTWELNIETYGYGKKRKTYDPDYEHVESAKFKEFERLEAQGYDEELKDPDHDKIRKVRARVSVPSSSLFIFRFRSVPILSCTSCSMLFQFVPHRNLPAPGLGSKPGQGSKEGDKKKFAPDDYIIPPKVPQMSMAKLKAPAKVN